MGRHELVDVIDRHVRAKRAGTRPHDSLDPFLVSLSELFGRRRPRTTRSSFTTTHASHPAAVARSRTARMAPPVCTSGRPGEPPLPREHAWRSSLLSGACRQPVELSADIVVHLPEPEAFEPPRGSWAQVSGHVPAVDEHGPERIELFLGSVSRFRSGRLMAPGRWSASNSSLAALPPLHAFPHESPDVSAIDFLRHRYPRLARSNRFKLTINSSSVDYQS